MCQNFVKGLSGANFRHSHTKKHNENGYHRRRPEAQPTDKVFTDIPCSSRHVTDFLPRYTPWRDGELGLRVVHKGIRSSALQDNKLVTFMRGWASASLSFLSGSCTMAMKDVAPDSLAIILAHRKKPFHSPSDVHTFANMPYV